MPMFVAATVVDLFFVSVIILSAIAISSADDPSYEECQPRSCSIGPNISFPFYLVDHQKNYCGAPFDGFAVKCTNAGLPFLNISGNSYEIQNIFYRAQSMNMRLMRASDCTPYNITNTTLPEYFHYDNDNQDLYLFDDCGEHLNLHRHGYNKLCGYVALLPNEKKSFERAKSHCSRIVVVPVKHDGGGVVNASEYLAKGIRLNWNVSDCTPCERSGGRCGYNTSTLHFACFCRDRPHFRTCGDEEAFVRFASPPMASNTSVYDRKKRRILLATIIPGAVVLVLFIIVLFLFWRQKTRIQTREIHLRNIPSISSSTEVEASSLHGIPIFSYKELQEATCNFSDSRELGDGGFGTVYYGKLGDGREVAVKRLYERNHKRLDHFMNEVNTLTCLKHQNLVTLYGCTSRTSRELLLVYEYIPNGTVASHLHGEKSRDNLLPWGIRMEIAVQTASALVYLHKSDIIHRDIKTDNILLDDHFSVKVADFGLSRLFPNDVTHVSTAPQGTPGYVDPEYHQCYQLTDKSDVYSFGVVLIELISSMPAVDITRSRSEINLANLAVNIIRRCALHELIDPRFGYGSDPTVTYMAEAVAELAFQCLHMEREIRPSMNEILRVLKDIKAGDECGRKWTGFNRNVDRDDA